MINSLSKTDDFIKHDKIYVVKPMIFNNFIKMINLFNETDDFIKDDKFT